MTDTIKAINRALAVKAKLHGDTAAPRFTAVEMYKAAQICDDYGKTKVSDMLRQAAADLAERPTREDIDRAVSKGLSGYSIDLEAFPMIREDIIDALIAAGVKVRP